MTASPRTDPKTWDRGQVGGFAFPPVEGGGVMSIDCSGSIDVDDKKKAGSAASTPTVQSEMECEVSVTLEWDNKHWAMVEPIIVGLMPDGLPRDIDHPKAQLYKVASVLLKKVSNLEIGAGGGHGKITYSGKQWKPEAAKGLPVTLKLGSRGAEVTRWKLFLRGAPTNDANVTSGDYFDASADTATRTFQAAEKLTVNGIVGAETFAAASKYGYAPPKTTAATSGSVTKTPAWSDPLDAFLDAVGDSAGDGVDNAQAASESLFDKVF